MRGISTEILETVYRKRSDWDHFSPSKACQLPAAWSLQLSHISTRFSVVPTDPLYLIPFQVSWILQYMAARQNVSFPILFCISACSVLSQCVFQCLGNIKNCIPPLITFYLILVIRSFPCPIAFSHFPPPPWHFWLCCALIYMRHPGSHRALRMWVHSALC